jgi:hypothetical protein
MAKAGPLQAIRRTSNARGDYREAAAVAAAAAEADSGHWPKPRAFFCNSQAVQKIEKVNKNKEFFFEKKNQKTFAPLREVVARPLAKNYQSFFASFCSQKEVPSFYLAF